MTNSKEYELKDVLVCTRTSTVLVASELDDPLQAIANAEALWPEGQLAKSENETSSIRWTFMPTVRPTTLLRK